MKFVRHLAVLALAFTAVWVASPGASAKSALCPDCYIEGVVQGTGIEPDPTTLQINLNVWTYQTDPLAVPQHYNVSFVGTITQGALDQQGIFEAVGTLTSNIPSISFGTFNGPATVETFNDLSKPSYPIQMYAEQISTGLHFYADIYQKPNEAGIAFPPQANLWTAGLPVGQPLVGTAFMS